jgi:hypothetical protein
VSLDRDLIDAVRDLDEHELRRLLILARAHLERTASLGPGGDPEVRLRRQMVRCGKATCASCPHGPYWYAYWTEDGRRRQRYIGKLLEEG